MGAQVRRSRLCVSRVQKLMGKTAADQTRTWMGMGGCPRGYGSRPARPASRHRQQASVAGPPASSPPFMERELASPTVPHGSSYSPAICRRGGGCVDDAHALLARPVWRPRPVGAGPARSRSGILQVQKLGPRPAPACVPRQSSSCSVTVPQAWSLG